MSQQPMSAEQKKQEIARAFVVAMSNETNHQEGKLQAWDTDLYRDWFATTNAEHAEVLERYTEAQMQQMAMMLSTGAGVAAAVQKALDLDL